MPLKNVNTVLATVCALFVLCLGLSFILAPEASTQGVGLPTWPAGNGDGFLIMKGTREFSMGLVIGILLLTGHRRALGWVLLMEAVAPFGDMINVLAHHGPLAAAFGIHGLTSELIAITGLLTLRETSKAHTATAPAPAAQLHAPKGRPGHMAGPPLIRQRPPRRVRQTIFFQPAAA